MQKHFDYVRRILRKDGPQNEEDYVEFENWLCQVAQDINNKKLRPVDISRLREAFGDALTHKTLQGFALTKPHGYAGDYEIIDKIYRMHISDESHLRNWDKFFHSQKAPKAVRNRKKYFHNLLDKIDRTQTDGSHLNVLNVASGPCRDVFEFLNKDTNHQFFFDCVEYDNNAISYAANLCQSHISLIKFHHVNALRFNSTKRFQLVWSAGLFDYLNDKTFILLLKRLYRLVDQGGELVIGNFSNDNESRFYMEVIGEWILKHRSADELVSLAEACKIDNNLISVGKEPEGVNLFLHVAKP